MQSLLQSAVAAIKATAMFSSEINHAWRHVKRATTHSPPETPETHIFITSRHAASWLWFTNVDWGSERSDVTELSGGLGVAGVSSDRLRSIVSAASCCSTSPSGSDISDCSELGAFDKRESCARKEIEQSLLLLASSPKTNKNGDINTIRESVKNKMCPILLRRLKHVL